MSSPSPYEGHCLCAAEESGEFSGEENELFSFPVGRNQVWVGDADVLYTWAAPCFGSLYVKFPPGQNIFTLTINLRGESAQMEKLTRPYLWCSLGMIEESEPWFMSGLKLSSLLPANCIPLLWSCSFIRAHPSRSGLWSRIQVWFWFKYI